MISIRRMSLGSGYRYLMESVAVGDGAGRGSSMVDYYAASGTPAGRFLGAGLAALDDGNGVATGSVVSEEQLFLMLGMCADPVSAKPLGRAPNHAVASMQRRIAQRITALPSDLAAQERADTITRIESEEQARSGGIRAPVAGFDLTFSPTKSVSIAWALADPDTKSVIYDCHRRAIEIVLQYAEREVFRSRSGTDGVVDEDVVGVIAAAFTHWESRSGDPQLHDHVIVMNRAQSVSDGKWRTIDSRGLFKAVVALSEMHQGVLADLLTERLGWGWDGRPRKHSDAVAWDVEGVSEALLTDFSSRSSAIEVRKEELISEWVSAHGRQPTATEVIRLRQRATLETRPDKAHRSLTVMTAEWQGRCAHHLDDEPSSWVASLADRNDLPPLRRDDLADPILEDVARVTLGLVAGKRATFSRWNVAAEAHRQLQGVRFASPADRIQTAERIVDCALAEALLITPLPLHRTPERFQRADGSSRFSRSGPRDLHDDGDPPSGEQTSRRWTSPGRAGRNQRQDECTPGRLSRAGPCRRADRLLRPSARCSRRSGRRRKIHDHEAPANRVGGPLRRRFRDRSGPLRSSRRGPGRRAGDRDGEHSQVVDRAPARTGPPSQAPPPS